MIPVPKQTSEKLRIISSLILVCCASVCSGNRSVFHEEKRSAPVFWRVCRCPCRAFVFVFPTARLIKLSTLFPKLTGACAGPRTTCTQTRFTYANMFWLPAQTSSGGSERLSSPRATHARAACRATRGITVWCLEIKPEENKAEMSEIFHNTWGHLN